MDDWQHTELAAQLRNLNIVTATTPTDLLGQLALRENEAASVLMLDGLAAYAQSWGNDAAVWLVLAVTRMIREITEEYPTARFGVVPPDTFAIASVEEDQQEIAHRCLTAYADIYDVLLRTQRKPSSPIWHRRAVTQYFPQLVLDVASDSTLLDNDS